ncbi:MAG: hypothetical protein LBM13_04320 [Candidatus Ancillula sp.]|jgi:hypothetical protein|nr:hypothetical protein [Candidatus Ancillula sp.]
MTTMQYQRINDRISQWQSQPAAKKLQQRREMALKLVVNSMAMEREDVSEKWIKSQM